MRVLITGGGVSIGRSPTSTIVLSEPEASRTQAIVLMTPDGPALWPLGRNPVLVDGEEAVPGQLLASGQVLFLPGEELAIATAPGCSRSFWMLEDPAGLLYGLSGRIMSLGGGRDSLHVAALPPDAFRLTPLDSAVAVEPFRLDVDAPAHFDLGDGDALDVAGRSWRLHRERDGEQPSTTGQRGADLGELPVSVSLLFRPNGGTLVVRFDHREVSVELSELRARLVSTLLRPPGGRDAGDFVSNEDVIRRVWPRRTDRGATDLNVLVYWTRRSFVHAGLPSELVDRGHRTGGIRFRLAPGARVEVR